MLSKLRRYAFALLIPGITVSLAFYLRASAGYFWQYADPSYQYLFNALHMVKGIGANQIEHPGTPLQILIYSVISLFNLGQSSAHTIQKVILNPEFYLQAVYITLMGICFLTSFSLAVFVYNKTQDKIAALLTQLPWISLFFLRAFETNLPVIPVITNVGPDCLLMSVINLFNLCFLNLYFAKTPKEEFRATLWLGAVCGLGMATKLIFITLLVGGLIITPLRGKLVFILAVIAGFVLGTITVIHKYPLIFKFIHELSSHTGHYGSGPQGFINWSESLKYLQMITQHYWFFVVLSVGLLLWSSVEWIQNKDNRNARFLWVALVATLLQYLATTKHFSFHYLLPAMALFGSIFPLFYLGRFNQSPLFQKITLGAIVAFMGFCLYSHLGYASQMSHLSRDLCGLQKQIETKYPDAMIIPASSPASNIYLNQMHGLFFGNYAGVHKENDELNAAYPHDYYFDTERTEAWEREDGYGIRDFYGNRVFADDLLASGRRIIFLKLGSQFPEPALNVQAIERSQYASAYMLVSSTEKQAFGFFYLASRLLEKGEYPQALSMAIQSRNFNFEPKAKIEYIINIIYNHLQQK